MMKNVIYMVVVGPTLCHHVCNTVIWSVFSSGFCVFFNVSYSSSSTYVVYEATYHSSWVVVSFASKFTLYVSLMMDSLGGWIFLVGVTYTTSYKTYLWVSYTLPGVLKYILLPYIVTHCLVELDTLEGSLKFFTLACVSFIRKITCWSVCLVEIFYRISWSIQMDFLDLSFSYSMSFPWSTIIIFP